MNSQPRTAIMKKTITLLILLITIIVSAKTPLTKNLLCNTDWEDYWEFRQDGFFCRKLSGMDTYIALGRYKIRDGKLYLTSPAESDWDAPFAIKNSEYFQKPFETECVATLTTSKNAFKSSCYLLVENIKIKELHPEIVKKKGSYIPEGKLISITNTVAITLGDSASYQVGAKTTSNLSLRATPSAKGKRLPWYTIEEINHNDNEAVYRYDGYTSCRLSYLKTQTEDLKLTNLAYIPESTSLGAIARTYYKDTINGVADYWYYVDADNSSYSINGEGWVWGEFLKLQ